MLCIAVVLALIISFILLLPLKHGRGRSGAQPVAGKVVPAGEREGGDMAVEHLSGIIQCKTVSQHPGGDFSEFRRLHALLRQYYPLVHKTMELRIINDYTLLYRWRCNNTATQKQPILLMGHQDVVPVSPGTEADWKHPPFSGQIADGFVWGRGAIDMKNMLAAELEAMERLLAEGFQPDRDIYLLFGHDEEIMGLQGAKKAAEQLKAEGLYFDFILDEGCHFSSMAHYGAEGRLAANIGIYEKGYVDLRITAEGNQGHSSTPGKGTALSDLARAIGMLERGISFKPELTPAYRQRLDSLLPYSGYTTRFTATYIKAFTNSYIKMLKNSPEEYAMLRNTMATTMISGSKAPNVLPARAEAMFNFRLLPGYYVGQLKQTVEQLLPERIQKEYPTAHDASQLSSTDSRAYRILSDTILQTFDRVVVAPSGFPACTDSRHLCGLAQDIYRFIPFISNYKHATGMHGTDEKVEIDDYLRGIDFFVRLIKNYCGENNTNGD